MKGRWQTSSFWISVKAFNAVPHGILVDKLSNDEINRFTMHWLINWLNGKAQRVAANRAVLGWRAGTSNVPQGSILGSFLSNIFINDLEAGVEYIFSKFADNTKLGGAANSLEGQEILQRDFDTLEQRAISNGMKFSKGKCQVLQLEWSNAGHSYRLEDGWLENSFAEKDL